MRKRNKRRARLVRQRRSRKTSIEYQQLEARNLLAVEVGLNFTGSMGGTDSTAVVPDAMGAVGPDHIVELINERYAVYDKTGTLLESSNLNDFWTNTAGATISGNTIDPRIVYDPTADRYFATSIGDEVDNQLYLGISMSDDPTAGWRSAQFQIDSAGEDFSEFDTLGVDANGIYITTNNNGPIVDDVSIFSIPKPDLLGLIPSVARMTRFEGLDPAVYGSTIQVAVNHGVSTRAVSLSTFESGTSLIRTDIVGPSGPGAGLSSPMTITVPAYEPAPDARQPEGGPLANMSPQFYGNVYWAAGSIWAAHVVEGSTSNSAIRWYQIDVATNALTNWGTIENVDVDYLNPSIAVNEYGVIAIGFTATALDLFPSAAAVTGFTATGLQSTPTVEFGDVKILREGLDSFFSGPTNQWGNYSATRVDPSDPFSFWTFQEYANLDDNWSTRVSELGLFDVNPTIRANDDANTIVVQSSSDNGAWVEIEIDGVVTDVFERRSLTTLNIAGMGGDDVFIVNLSHGQPIPFSGITLRGADGYDTIQVTGGTSGQSWIVNDDGSGNIDSAIRFTDFEELIGSDNDDQFTINETGTDLLVRGGLGNDHLAVGGPIVGELELRGEVGDDHYRVPIETVTTVMVVDTIGSEEDVLNVFGTVGDDDITFNNNTVELNGTSTSDFVFEGVEALEVDGAEGNDTLNIQATEMATSFLGSEGDDLFNIASDAPFNQGNSLSLTGSFLIDGGEGRNRMIASSFNTTARTVVVDDSVISGFASIDIHYTSIGGFSIPGDLAGITLIGSEVGADRFDVRGVLSTHTLRIEGAGGNDRFTVRAGVQGNVELDGQDGSDISQVAMKGLSNRSVFIDDTGGGDTDRLAITTGNTADLFEIKENIVSLLAETLFTGLQTEVVVVNTFGGDDTINVGANDTDFVRVITGDGNDSARVDATRGITGLRFDAGEGNDTIDVRKSVAATFVQVYGGLGDDQVDIGSESFGSGRYDGEDGSDKVNVDLIGRTNRRVNARDSGSTGDDGLVVFGTGLVDRLKLTTQTLTNKVEKVFFNENTEHLTLNAGLGNDIIDVNGTSSPNTRILGGQGSEQVTVRSTTQANALTIDAGSGNDVITVVSTTPGSTLSLLGQAGDDLIRIGSSSSDNNGNLGRMRGKINVVGGTHTVQDRLYVNDHGSNGKFDYFVSDSVVANLVGPQSVARTNFAGINHNSVEFVRVDGNDKENYFSVRPSESTTFYVDGNLPVQTGDGSRGDFLNVLGDDSDGRIVSQDPFGNGKYTFANGFQDIIFESIEKHRTT